MFWKIARTNHNPSPAPLEACPKVETSLYSANPAAEVSKSQSKIISCPLDNCMFAAKHLKDSTLYHIWQKDLKRRNQQPVMVHANWISGKDAKKLAMQVHGLWIAKPVPISGPLPNRLLLTNSNHTEVSRDLQAKPSPMIRQSQGVAVGKAVGGRAGANSNDAFTKVAMRKTVKRAPHMPNSGFNEGIQHTGNWTCIKPTNSNVSIK